MIGQSKVTLLEKSDGSSWSREEVDALVNKGMIEIEQLPKKPHRLALMNKPLRGGTYGEMLGHQNFSVREVDYRDRWA